eukprot:531364-Prorocentrum_minimum.AAC.2
MLRVRRRRCRFGRGGRLRARDNGGRAFSINAGTHPAGRPLRHHLPGSRPSRACGRRFPVRTLVFPVEMREAKGDDDISNVPFLGFGRVVPPTVSPENGGELRASGRRVGGITHVCNKGGGGRTLERAGGSVWSVQRLARVVVA